MACSFQRRTILLCSVLVAGLSVLSVRLVDLQLVNRHKYADKGGDLPEQKSVLPARRGLLVDRQDEILARNLAVTTVFVDRYHLRDPHLAALALSYDRASRTEDWKFLDAGRRSRRVLEERKRILDELEPQEIVSKNLAYSIGVLARPLGLQRDEMRARIEETDKMDVPLVKDVPEDLAERIEELAKEHWIQGFRFERSFRRWYAKPQLASHVIGFTDIENLGKCGAEAALEGYLAGRDGFRTLKRDARGLLLPPHAGHLRQPRAGLNVQLTLDMGVQAIVEEELDRGLAEFHSTRGSAIVFDPNTGEIMAMANRPHFDLNLRDGVEDAGVNFAIQAIYEPGSTFKIVAVAGALDAGVVTPRTSVNCHGGYYREGVVEVRDHHPYGTLTVERVVQKSSNIGAYLLARQLGRQRYFAMAERLGFGVASGIQLSGESAGVLHDTGNPVDFSRVAYGYAVSVTPLQVAAAYGAVANGGLLMRPRIASRVVADDGAVIEEFRPEVVGRAMKASTAEQMRKMLEMVVNVKGTAQQAKVPGFRVGGKTGTAVKHNPNGPGYLAGHYTVSFAGILPIDAPEFVGVVVVDDPQTDPVKVPRYGGTIAAPIFARIAGRVAAHLKLEPTEPVEQKEQLAATLTP